MVKRDASQIAAATERIAKRAAKAARWAGGPKAKNVGTKYFHKGDKGSEVKYIDLGALGANLNAGTANVNECTSAIVQGTDINGNRIGNKIIMTSLRLCGTVGNTTAGLTALPGGMDRIRVVIYVDKQADGASTVGSNLYGPGGVGTVNAPSVSRTMNFIDRYDILYSEDFVLNPGGETAHNIDKFIKCSIPVRYQLATSGIPVTNSIGYALYSSNTTGGNFSIWYGNMRLQYTDA